MSAALVVPMLQPDRLPAPLTPRDCDLRSSPYMPFYGDRLLDSQVMSNASATEFRAALRLWWAAWKSFPAASLPDDDKVLADRAGLSRDMRAWRKVKAVALHG